MKMKMQNFVEGLAEFVKLKIKEMKPADREIVTKFCRAILEIQKLKKANYD